MLQKPASDMEHPHPHRHLTQHTPEEPRHTNNIDHHASSAPLALSRVAGRGNSSARAEMLQVAQQTYGNRAVQRLLRRSSPTIATTPIQREPEPPTTNKTPTAKPPEAQSLYDQLLAQMQKVFQMKTNGSSETDTDQFAMEMQKFQQMMQKYQMMMQMLSNLSQSRHESLKGIANNMR